MARPAQSHNTHWLFSCLEFGDLARTTQGSLPAHASHSGFGEENRRASSSCPGPAQALPLRLVRGRSSWMKASGSRPKFRPRRHLHSGLCSAHPPAHILVHVPGHTLAVANSSPSVLSTSAESSPRPTSRPSQTPPHGAMQGPQAHTWWLLPRHSAAALTAPLWPRGRPCPVTHSVPNETLAGTRRERRAQACGASTWQQAGHGPKGLQRPQSHRSLGSLRCRQRITLQVSSR